MPQRSTFWCALSAGSALYTEITYDNPKSKCELCSMHSRSDAARFTERLVNGQTNTTQKLDSGFFGFSIFKFFTKAKFIVVNKAGNVRLVASTIFSFRIHFLLFG